jgi:hypothetical protein
MTPDPVKVFFLEPTNKFARSLRRGATGACAAGPYTEHTASVVIETFESKETPVGGDKGPPHTDPRWPTACGQCGEAIGQGGFWVVDNDRIYRAVGTGAEMTLDGAPPGACWDATWYPDNYRGPDGRSLTVRLPGDLRNDWIIDSKASNCKRAPDYAGKCWVRSGKPEDGTLDVRSCGCGAGAGSIRTPRYHGFLHRGHLIECPDKKKSKKSKK